MATLSVSPNRMELLRLKKKQQFAQRGHKLLKDKLEGLLKDFIGIVKEYGLLRNKVDAEIKDLFQQFIVASASMSGEAYRSALAFPECYAFLTLKEKLIINERYEAWVHDYDKGNLAGAIAGFDKILDIYRQIEDFNGQVPALFSLGLLHEESGHTKQSQEFFKRVLAINPDHIQAKQKLSPKN